MLSIIIVNFRSAALIKEALRTLYAHNPALDMEVIVVDNCSGDNSQPMITNAFPAVQYIQMDYNVGFARANNAGMRAATGEAFLLLNPDTLCLDDAITRLYHRLMKSTHIAAGAQLLDVHQQPQISGSYFMKGGLNHLLPLPYWGAFLRWLAYRSGTKVPNVKDAQTEVEVDWISGACLMVKRDAVKRAGMMDEDFFLYAEEVEWCSRLKQQGALVIYGDCRIIHLEGGSIDSAQDVKERGYDNLYDKKGLQLMVSNHLRVRKQFGLCWYFFLLLNYTWGVAVFAIASFFDDLLHGHSPFRQWGKVLAFTINVAKLWAFMPLMVLNRPYFYKMF